MSQIFVNEHQQGCTSKFNISARMEYDFDSTKLSNPYNICDIARIQFRLEHRKNMNYVSVLVSSAKVEAVKDCTVKVNITCQSPEYSDHSIVGTDTEEWRSMGKCMKASYIQNVAIFDIEVTIRVSKITEPSLFAKMYEDVDEHIDFHLSAVDGTVPVHKALLAASSDMFRTMLKGEWKETTEGRIELKGATRQTLQNFKSFMYLGTLPEDADELLPLVELAARYLINSLRSACIGKLTKLVTSENLYAMLEVASANNIPDLAFALLETTPGSIVTTVSKTRNKQVSKSADEK